MNIPQTEMLKQIKLLTFNNLLR